MSFIVASPEKCIGCHTCEVACAVVHVGGVALTARHYFPRLRVIKLSNISAPVMCRQCENAPCVAVCPTGALYRKGEAIESVSHNCIDCKSCVVACPFGAIEIVSQPDLSPQIIKCDLCSGQQSGPACVSVCPTDALAIVTAAGLSLQQQKKQQKAAKCSRLSGLLLLEGSNHG
ncbi:4Fe-4S dicluster domain-containing protein [Pantoea sp. BAV 3049]|uniref:4Fe-4S dicluster domain-containing protein n=1 Tax=Pantoea sp. BAV 3049 TaxID=2654188 RepID=UPI00131E5BC1|nr:4Fe-4S dicluster domain-containing protein [Pantoea sp. BAV 3049]